jgi:hypothetical protein
MPDIITKKKEKIVDLSLYPILTLTIKWKDPQHHKKSSYHPVCPHYSHLHIYPYIYIFIITK